MDKYNLLTAYDEEDDLYSGFNEFHPTLNTSSLIQDTLARDVKNQQTMLQVPSLTKNSYTLIYHQLLYQSKFSKSL